MTRVGVQTPLGFAAQLDEQVDRIHGVNVAMVGLREILGDEVSVAGAHQLTIDLANHAEDLRRQYQRMLEAGAVPPLGSC